MEALSSESAASAYDRRLLGDRIMNRARRKYREGSTSRSMFRSGASSGYNPGQLLDRNRDRGRFVYLNHRQVFEHEFKTNFFAALSKTYPVRDVHLGSCSMNAAYLPLLHNIALAAMEHISALQGVEASSFFGDVPFACHIAVMKILARDSCSQYMRF